jgi:hypothetical protein
LLDDGQVPTVDAVRELVVVDKVPAPPEMAAYEVDLGEYDALLSEEVAS